MKKIAIIGAGIGGLFAGNLLAKKGHKVTIFEAHSSPGGYTAGFWKKGFYFESGTLSFESSDAVFKAMKNIGVFDKIKFARQKIGLKAEGLDGVCENYRDLKKLFYSSYPLEKPRMDKYFAVVDQMCNLIMTVMKPVSFIDFLCYPFRFVNFLRFYEKYKKITIMDFTAQYFERDSSLYRLLSGFGYPDMSAAIIGPAYLSFFDDYWTVEDGMQSWADILAENFRSLGGDLKLNAPVDKILTENMMAIGVISKNNEYRTDYVISAADYKKTLLQLLDDPSLLPDALRKKIENTPVSEGIFTVYLGLNLTNEYLKKLLKVPHVSYHYEAPDTDIHNSKDEKYFEKTSVMLYSPSLMNPKLAPEGKSSLMILAFSPYRWMNNWGGGDKAKYRELKDKVKKALIAKASAVISNLTDNIEFEDAATPLTYERYTGNTDGATSAWSWNPKNKFYDNIMSINIRTPVKNLLIGSCWSCQIGGVPSAIGAAYKCAAKIK